MGRWKDERNAQLPISFSCGDLNVTKTQRAEMLAQLKGSVFGVDFSLFFPFSPFFVVVVSVVHSEAEG